MDRHTRKDLKTDKFAEGVEHGYELMAQHRSQVRLIAAIVLGVVILGGGFWLYRSRQANARAKALADALYTADAVVSANPSPPNKNYPTQEEKDKAVEAAYQAVIDQYKGSQEAAIAQLFLAGAKADKGDMAAATKMYEDMIGWAPADYASVARVSLADLYAGADKVPEAEKQLQAVIDSPTTFVTKEQATLELGRILTRTDPARARQLLEPLQTNTSSAVSRAAISALGDLPAAASTATPEKAN